MKKTNLIYEKQKLEDIATCLTGIPPIKDKEYQKIIYVKNNNKVKQTRSNLYKSTKRFL